MYVPVIPKGVNEWWKESFGYNQGPATSFNHEDVNPTKERNIFEWIYQFINPFMLKTSLICFWLLKKFIQILFIL